MRSITNELRRSSSLLALVGASALVLGLVGPVAAQSIPGPLKVTDSGPSGSPGYAIKGITGFQNDTGVFGYGTVASSAINIDGVVGYVQTPQSVGTVGWSASTGTSAYGIFGHSDTGPGVFGVNINGASASVYGVSTGFAGVWGDNTAESGVYGTTETTGTGFGGVGGKDFSAACCNYGTYGVSGVGGGLYGASNAAAGSSGQGVYATGLSGSDSIDAYQHNGGDFGIFSSTDSGFAAGWFTAGSSGVWSLVGTNDVTGASAILATNSGVGAEVAGEGGGAATPVLAAEEFTGGMYAFSTYNDVGSNVGPGANNESFIVSDTADFSGLGFGNGSDANVSGDLYVTGEIYSDCSFAEFPSTAGTQCEDNPTVRTTTSGAKVKTYGASQSLPTMEDFGEAQLVNGQAAVTLERTFASTIDANRSYLVFVTPEGDCHGLYVASKTPRGFVVRELMGGHNTLAFQYRIVAHPFGDSATRLAAAGTKPHFAITQHRLAQPLAARSTQFASMVARSKLQEAKYGHETVHQYARPARPVMPVVKVISQH